MGNYLPKEIESLFDHLSNLSNDHKKLIKKAIRSNKLDLQNKYGWTALHIAIYNDLPEIARFIIENGAKLDIQNMNYTSDGLQGSEGENGRRTSRAGAANIRPRKLIDHFVSQFRPVRLEILHMRH